MIIENARVIVLPTERCNHHFFNNCEIICATESAIEGCELSNSQVTMYPKSSIGSNIFTSKNGLFIKLKRWWSGLFLENKFDCYVKFKDYNP